MTLRRCLLPLISLCLFSAGALAVEPEKAVDVDRLADRLIGAGADLVREASGGELLLDKALLSSPEMKALYRRLYAALQSVDLEQLADLKPMLVQAIPMLYRIEGGKAYADWLRQRLDYADVAQRVVTAYPRVAPVSPSTQRPQKPAPASQTRTQQNNVSGDVDVWQRKLAKRAAPTGAAALLPQMKAIFEQQGMPPELAWLAEVESSFNPEARSPVGAVGLYQFMPATAESLGLSLKPRDEREDPAKSGEAAARYLKRLHGRFNSWPLALAAYNAGEGRVNKLLREQHVSDFEGIRDRLPAETRMYVPKLDAVLRLREGKTLAALHPPA